MSSNVFSCLCFCNQQKTENSTINVEFNDKSTSKYKEILRSPGTEHEMNYSTNNNTLNICSQISKINRPEIPFKNSFNKIQNSKSNLIKIFNDNNTNKKKKMKHKLIDENEYFNNFEKEVDNLIQENLNVKSVSESDSSEILSKQ